MRPTLAATSTVVDRVAARLASAHPPRHCTWCRRHLHVHRVDDPMSDVGKVASRPRRGIASPSCASSRTLAPDACFLNQASSATASPSPRQARASLLSANQPRRRLRLPPRLEARELCPCRLTGSCHDIAKNPRQSEEQSVRGSGRSAKAIVPKRRRGAWE